MRAHHLLPLALLLACSDKDEGGDDDDGGGTAVVGTDADGDGFYAMPEGDDCDDDDPDINSFAAELCDGIDNDCDGVVDEDSAEDAVVWYLDDDEDGFGDDDRTDRACEPPEDDGPWVDAGGDCDDSDDDTFPGADELCNGVDDDCDEDIDEDDAIDAVTRFLDEDGDGFGDPSTSQTSCLPDGDGVWVEDDGDCDDGDPAVHPDATEICNDRDDDCDDLVDDADDDVDETTWATYFEDFDGDGYGDATRPTLTCSRPDGYVSDDTDCDDRDDAVNPGATEICDAADTDEDCNSLADDDDPDVAAAGLATWVIDADGDGYGSDRATPVFACDDPSSGPATYVEDDDSDCDDGDGDINPGATEVCDDANTDEDCSGDADDDDPGTLSGTMSVWYVDADEDGYGSSSGALTRCDDPSSGGTIYVDDSTDCDDRDHDVNPGQSEVCDPLDTDEDCSGHADDDDPGTIVGTMTTWYLDDDEDGYGDTDRATVQCEDPSTASSDWLADGTDCDDADPAVNPGAEEVCDDIDNDCDPATSTDGFVSFVSSSGSVTDYTAALAAGSPASYVDIDLSEDGELSICGGTFYGRFNVSAEVVVQGYDGSVLSGGDDWTIFKVEPGGDLTVRDLTLQDGDSEYAGWYVFGEGYVASGGAIWAEESAVTLEDCTVQDSTARAAGCIYVHDGTLDISDSTITGCASTYSGGGILLGYYVDATITGSEISENTVASGQIGAGIYAEYSDLDLTDSLISDHSSSYASALYNNRGTVSCTGSASTTAGFLRNESTGSSSYYTAIYLTGSSGDTLFVADTCDLGEGPDDNEGYDIKVYYNDYAEYGDDATFTCVGWDGCS